MKIMRKKTFITKNPRQTKKLGLVFAQEIARTSPREHAIIIGLEGNLGSGKTTFVQGFAEGLGIQVKVLSPTFVIMKLYPFRGSEVHLAISGGKIRNLETLYHIDCYRIKDEQDILGLGWDAIMSNPRNVVLIEWSERIQKILPQDTISVSFKTLKPSKSHERRITFWAK